MNAVFALPDTETLILALTFIGAFASVLVISLPFLQRDRRAARLKVLTKRREELSRQQRDQLAEQRARRQPKAHVNVMKGVLERFKLDNMLASTEIKQMLQAAGWRQRSAVVTFVFARFAAATGMALVAFVFVWLNYKLPVFTELAIGGGSGAFGYYLPVILAKNAAQKRQDEMTKGFPDSLDLLLICVQAGLSIEAAVARVSEEIAESAAVLSREFALMAAELAYLGDRGKAYSNFAERTGLPAARSLSTSLTQSDRYGTALSVALKVLATENRDARMALAERKAAALPAKLTVPMIIFFLPALFLVIMGPAIIQISNM